MNDQDKEEVFELLNEEALAPIEPEAGTSAMANCGTSKSTSADTGLSLDDDGEFFGGDEAPMPFLNVRYGLMKREDDAVSRNLAYGSEVLVQFVSNVPYLNVLNSYSFRSFFRCEKTRLNIFQPKCRVY